MLALITQSPQLPSRCPSNVAARTQKKRFCYTEAALEDYECNLLTNYLGALLLKRERCDCTFNALSSSIWQLRMEIINIKNMNIGGTTLI